MRTFLIFVIVCTFLAALAMAGNENLESSLRGEVENKIREKRQLFGNRGGHGGGIHGGRVIGGRGVGGRGFGGGFDRGHGRDYGRRHYG